MIEGVYMTEKNLNRAAVFQKIANKQLSQSCAAKELNISTRHLQRLYKSFQKNGLKTFASKQKGKPSNNQLNPLIKQQVIELISCEIYSGFGPKFMSETLEKLAWFKNS